MTLTKILLKMKMTIETTLYEQLILHKSVIPRNNKNLQEQEPCHIHHIRHIDPNKEVKCPDCEHKAVPYWMKIHRQNTGHRDWRTD
jgi:hypothetical protein